MTGGRSVNETEKLRQLRAEIDKGIRSLDACEGQPLDIEDFLRKENERKRPMKFLMIDDHGLIRDALRGVLQELKQDATVSEASNYRQAMRLLERNPDYGVVRGTAGPNFTTIAQIGLARCDARWPPNEGKHPKSFARRADQRHRYGEWHCTSYGVHLKC